MSLKAREWLALGEGSAWGMLIFAGSHLVGYPANYPTGYLLPTVVLAYYVAWRVEKVARWFLLGGLLVGSISSTMAYFWFQVVATADAGMWEEGVKSLWASFNAVLESIVIPVAAGVAGSLYSAANYFATFYRHGWSWLYTLLNGTMLALVVWVVEPVSAVMVAIPMLYNCFLALWCVDLRLFHALLLAGTYGAVLYFCGSVTLPLYVAIMVAAALPEWVGWLYPEKRHVPDALPVVSVSVRGWQKFKLWGEALLLAIEFLHMKMENQRFIRSRAYWGVVLLLLALVVELVPYFWPVVPPFKAAVGFFLAFTGWFLLVAAGKYRLALAGQGGYGLALMVGRGLMGHSLSALLSGSCLAVIALIAARGRLGRAEKETRYWRELNFLP